MKFSSLFPLLQVRDVASTARYYRDMFGFTPVFESDWYVHLRGESEGLFELAVMNFNHDSIPPAGRKPSSGVILSFYVDDAASEAKRLESAGARIAQPLRDEVFGQRHVIIEDPNGILIDVIEAIEPDPEWLKQQQG